MGITFLVGIIEQTISEDKIRKMLSTKNKFIGYINALILGIFTPFCSCSTVPILAGLLKVNAPFGPTMAFLFTSPFLDPAVITLMLALLGWKITLIYSLIVLIIPVVIAILLDIFGFEKYIKNLNIKQDKKNEDHLIANLTKKDKIKIYLVESMKSAWKLYVSVLPYLLIGVIFGSVMHNIIPEEIIARYVGDNSFWAVPIATIIGIPLYVNSTTILPIGVALAKVGIGFGPIIALIIGGTGASIPEIILLKKLFKPQLLVAFIISVFVLAISAGYLVQAFI